ncbi:MAG: DUF1599 domain-containing protein [Muribaculaceae bacterium]|nr:DUF1599 domain-containing protein [Muribaculaceae bacterium]
MSNTIEEFDSSIKMCRDLYVKKLNDYGASWRLMRPCSITDQILIKATRIRSLETKGHAMVDEGIMPEFVGIVNYGIIGLIQLELGVSDAKDITVEQAVEMYDSWMSKTRTLMLAKNHDYDEAWRLMRVSSYTDLILTKLMRTKEIEDNNGATVVSEGIDANYMDMINYAIFGIIKLTEQGEAE